ncbi:accessory Sec-dependent serine-rich glycoprotein adhesin, partial [Streptococcus porcinus]
MLQKLNKSSFIETESKSRVKLHKSGKSWVKTTLASFGLIQLFKGGQAEERVSEGDVDFVVSKNQLLKGALGVGAVLGGTSIVNTAFAAETTSLLPVSSETGLVSAATDSTVVVASTTASNTTTLDQSSASQSLSSSVSMSQSLSNSQAQSTSEQESLSLSQTTSQSSTQISSSTLIEKAPRTAMLATTPHINAAITSGLATNEALTNIKVAISDMGAYDIYGNFIPSSTNDGIVMPTDGEAIAIDTSFDILDTATAGDQFTIQFSDTMKTNDLAYVGEVYTPIDITDPSGEVIATGTYDPTSKLITYTLTNYVDKYENVTAVLHLEKYVNRDTVPDNSTINVNYSVGNVSDSAIYKVIYSTPEVFNTAEIRSSFTSINETTAKVEQTFYINETGTHIMNRPYFTVKQGLNTANTIDSNSLIEVYRVPTGYNLPDSMEIQDYSTLTKLSPSIDYSVLGKASFYLDRNLITDSNTYVVRVVSSYDASSVAPVSQTGILYTNGDRAEYSNGLQFNSDTSSGTGNLSYKIGNYVWVDTNKDGIQNEGGSTGLANVLVTLTYTDGSTKAVRTDVSGYYEFSGLTDGETYTINFETPNGYQPTVSNATADDLDSDGASVTVTIKGADNMTLDTGFVVDSTSLVNSVSNSTSVSTSTSLSDSVRNSTSVSTSTSLSDSVRNSTSVSTSTSLSDSVRNSTSVSTSTSLSDSVRNSTSVSASTNLSDSVSNSTSVSTSTSLSDSVRKSTSVSTSTSLSDSVRNSTSVSTSTSLSDSVRNSTSVSASTSLSNSVRNSTSVSASTNLSDSVSNSTSVSTSTSLSDSVRNSTSISTSTSLSGSVSNSTSESLSTSVSQSSSNTGSEVDKVHMIGDTVWEDTNHNGTQDPGELGISGVTVTLTNPNGTTQTTTTDSNGHYEFTELTDGDYTVTFETPKGYTPTTANTGDDTKDSDGQVVQVTVAGSDNPTIDSGFVKETHTIGDTVWEDTNHNGTQDPGEPGISGVTVTLTNPNGSTQTTTTDSNGHYEFTELTDG